VIAMATKTILHYPRLDTVLMVEDTIKASRTEMTRTELWKKLPKQVQYQTFKIILEYLEKSNKITFAHNRIVWIATNPKLDKAIKQGTEY
jgi:hypothetical protein